MKKTRTKSRTGPRPSISTGARNCSQIWTLSLGPTTTNKPAFMDAAGLIDSDKGNSSPRLTSSSLLTVRSITRPTPGPWNSSIYLPFPNYPTEPDLNTITFSKHFYMNIKGLTWLHWRLNTLNFHKILQRKYIYNEITLLLCSTEMTWQSIYLYRLLPPPIPPSVLKYLSCRDNSSQMHFKTYLLSPENYLNFNLPIHLS